MNNLRRNKRKLYLCMKYEDGNKYLYREPIKLYENYLPTNSNGELITLGLEYPMYLKIKTSIREKDLFHPKIDCIFINNHQKYLMNYVMMLITKSTKNRYNS